LVHGFYPRRSCATLTLQARDVFLRARFLIDVGAINMLYTPFVFARQNHAFLPGQRVDAKSIGNALSPLTQS